MSEQYGQKDKSKQPTEAELYGAQGNEGQYGQGQYDSEGKPDPHGPQAREIHPDDQERKSGSRPTPDTKPKATDPATQPEVPQD
ncbi:hypothetical protein [Dictyobacter kobayashii]|uniref:Uncharacterized protein n=1 Tax=Dictyobacter kobayashii TaxID=2014872 RepID=A0A402AHA5_9CHLR|nr:hypothetical protein [Dictyobacter kobayashii]GCE18498.1 hypothetical protein KDK_22980 [Dictyobacter kobayashii]